MLMPARKSTEASVEAEAQKENSALPGNAVRKLENVALEVRRLQVEEGLGTQEISTRLQVSLAVVTQLFLQSYKMTMNTPEVFELQERVRVGEL